MFLNTCIDEFLVLTLKKCITNGMSVFGTSDEIPGHIQLLEQHFLTRFHIHMAKIFPFKPDDKIKLSQYFAHMIQKIKEAELLPTPGHDIMTSFCATNCPDTQLCLELLHSDYVIPNGMVNKALTYELDNRFSENLLKKLMQYRQGNVLNKNKVKGTKTSHQPLRIRTWTKRLPSQGQNLQCLQN